jgi:hypothetical protein
MPRGAAPEWRRRKEPLTDHLIKASVDAVNGIPDGETGRYGTLTYTGMDSKERAQEIRKSLFRCAKYLGFSMHAKPPAKQADGTYSIELTAISKKHAQAFVARTYGPDRSKWPYDPRRKNSE